MRTPSMRGTARRGAVALASIGALMLGQGAALAAEAAAPAVDSGHTAWMLTATALVLFMTIPGLSLFYAGMVRSKNVLSVLMQCFAITSLMTVIWALGRSRTVLCTKLAPMKPAPPVTNSRMP